MSARRRQCADRDRHVVAAAVSADDVGEQEGAPVRLVEAAAELPAHQRMQLGVLVDRAIDAHEEPRRFKIGEMLGKVRRRAGRAAGIAEARALEHG